MKRTNRLTSAAIGFIFIAMVCYIGFYAFRAFSEPLVTAAAVKTTLRGSAAVSGIILRDELLLNSNKPYIQVTAAEARRVSRGEVVALAYESDASLQQANALRRRELELQQLLALRSSAESGRDTALRGSVRALTAAVSRGEYAELDTLVRRCSSFVGRAVSEPVSDYEISALEAEISEMRRRVSGGTEPINSPLAGLFSTVVDGFEHLGTESGFGLTPGALIDMTEGRRETAPGTIGKISSGNVWYYAALIDSDDAERLRVALREARELGTSEQVSLEFGRYHSESIPAEVAEIGAEENGQCVVLLICRAAMAGTLPLRRVAADIVFGESTGLRVPRRAVLYDEEGAPFVYVMTGPQAEMKPIEIIYEAEDFVLAALPETENSLRAGNEVIVDGVNIEDGAVLR